VLLFSFDRGDSASILAKYRARENIPLGWWVGTALQADIDALLESIGFQVGKAGTEFAHANVLIFLDSNLRIAKWIYGTDYSGRDVDLALKVAAGESDWIGQHSQLLYALLLFAGSILCVALSYYLLQLSFDATSKSNRWCKSIDPSPFVTPVELHQLVRPGKSSQRFRLCRISAAPQWRALSHPYWE
jgi:hypothetical protein